MPDTIVIEESAVVEPKLARIKKHLTPKNIIIAVGSAIAIAGGAIAFALLRSDEEDFEAEQAKFDAEDASKIEADA